MLIASRIPLFTAAAFAVALPAILHAAGGGGGGGGGMPMSSAPQYDPVVEYQKGIDALRASQFADAKRAFDHVLSVVPRDANSAFLAGTASDGLNKPKDAKRYYEKALRNDGHRIDAQRALALDLVKLGERDKAQAQLVALNSAGTSCAGTCANAAEIAAAMRDVAAALAGQTVSFRMALPPGGAQGDIVYGEAVALINQHRYDAALASLRQAGQTFGPHPDVLTYLGFTYRKMGDLTRAEDYYRQALAIAPRHRGALEYYGELKVERGDLAGARSHLARLKTICHFGCYETEELSRWIALGHEPPA